MKLKEGATAALARAVVEQAVAEANNGQSPDARDGYLRTVDAIETRLSRAFEKATISDLIYTPRYWFIAEHPPYAPEMRGVVDMAIGQEIDSLSGKLSALEADFVALAAWLEAPGTIALIDTNTLMHCQPVNTIDWRTELKQVATDGDDAPRLVVPLAVITELDRKKFEGSDTMRGRAQKAIRSLRGLREGYTADEPAIVRAAGGSVVSLEIPRSDIGRTPLAGTDDELISFGEFLARAGRREVAVVTCDYNVQLRAERAKLKAVVLNAKYQKDKGVAAGESDA